MQQLGGLDAAFLNLETRKAPLHISGLAVYDQSTAPGELVRFKPVHELRPLSIPLRARR